MRLIIFRSFLAIVLMQIFFVSAASSANNNRLAAIEMQRDGLLNLINFMDRTPEIFDRPNGSDIIFSRADKETALDVWILYLDYMSTLTELADQSESSFGMSKAARQETHLNHALAFTAHYRFGLEFISRVKTDPELVQWYNTAHSDHGLPKNFYRRFSNEILSDFSTDLFDNFNQRFKTTDTAAAEMVSSDRAAIDELDRFKLLTSDSAGKISRGLYKTYYPIQKGVARGMGKVKVWRIGKTLITPEQALQFSRSFEPGDFYLTRKEWRLTNVGIPGFWTHSAMFIGTPAERALYFDTPEVHEWVASMGAESFEELLKQASPIYAAHPGADDWGDIRVIEALDAGVIFNSIETSLDADGAAVFRPKVNKLEKAKAIHASFYYTGQPYDFHFDFNSDDALVCSELIFKAYLPSDTQQGVEFPLSRAVGKKMLTPSEIAQWYDETVDTPEQKLDLVMFIDSNEKDRVAFQSTKEAFIGSWKRPDWYIFQQPERTDDRIASNAE